MASYPDLRPQRVGGRHLHRPTSPALQAPAAPRTTRHRGPVHPGLDLQARSRRPPPSGRADHARPRTTTTPAPSRSRAARTGVQRHRLHPPRQPGRRRRHVQHLAARSRCRATPSSTTWATCSGSSRRQYGTNAIQNVAAQYGEGDDHRHRPARRGAGPGRQPADAGQAARRGAQGLPQHHVVHRRQHRDGVRPGRDRAHADRAGGGLRHLRQRRHPLRARGGRPRSSTRRPARWSRRSRRR